MFVGTLHVSRVDASVWPNKIATLNLFAENALEIYINM